MKRPGRVWVLRLGHRLVRDDRTTLHVGLVARAFGANGIFAYNADPEFKEKIDKVVDNWGGDFKVEVVDDWKDVMKKWKRSEGRIVHLTMYGLELSNSINKISEFMSDILVVVGASKVPRIVYELSDYNISVGNQPHSEIAALAVFLDRLFGGEELKRWYAESRLRIIPNSLGKKLEVNRI